MEEANLTVKKYGDMLELPRPASKRTKMPRTDRAAQFAPFAALAGYDIAIKETARQTENKVELDEMRIGELDVKLQMLSHHLGDVSRVAITYFVPDAKKAGGAYVSCVDSVRKIDELNQLVIMNNGTMIPIYQIYDISTVTE